MATLTADEIEYIRAMSGDDCRKPNGDPDYEVSDVLLQKLHDKGLTQAPCGCTDALDVDVVLVLQVRVAKAAKLFNEDGENGSRSVRQKFENLKSLLADWETKCGLNGGVVTVSTFDLGLDAECRSEYAPYGTPWSWWEM